MLSVSIFLAALALGLIGLVLTSLSFLVSSIREREDFCRICRKCAVCCPSSSIPEGEPQEVNGSLRWKLNEMTCFEYWGKVGTDCNVCMGVCPWSHARTFPHRMIVWMVARNGKARRLFSAMDDIFYGKRPRPKDPPAWAAYRR